MIRFNNDLSEHKFVSPGTDLETHIRLHEGELARISQGSFDEIGSRMIHLFYIAQCFFLASDGFFYFSSLPEFNVLEQRFFEKKGIKLTDAVYYPERAKEAYSFLNQFLFNQIPHRYYDIAFTGYESPSHGSQKCPFSDCDFVWDCNAIVLSRGGILLGLNEGTAHLASQHHFLESGNMYATSPGLFYDHFMPKDPEDQKLFEKAKQFIQSGQADKIPYLHLGKKS